MQRTCRSNGRAILRGSSVSARRARRLRLTRTVTVKRREAGPAHAARGCGCALSPQRVAGLTLAPRFLGGFLEAEAMVVSETAKTGGYASA